MRASRGEDVMAGPTPSEDERDADDPVFEAAAAWVARLTSSDATDAERAAFAAWRDLDPAHAKAYKEMHGLWCRMGEVPDPRRRGRRLPTGLAVLALGAAILGLVADTIGLIDDWRADLSAPIGAIETAMLPDGSRVDLNTSAALMLRFTAGERRLALLRGEAAFEVVPDAARPFIVEGGGVQVRAVGTRFYVRNDGNAEPVGVAEGRVEVESASGRVSLEAGEAARLASNGALARSSADIARRLAWRERRLVFSGQPLATVLAELERYRRGRLVLIGDAAGAMRVSAVLDPRDPDAALDALAAILGLRVTRIAPFLVLVRPPV